MMKRIVALLAVLGGCTPYTGGAGDGGDDGRTTGQATQGGTSESGTIPDPSQGTSQGSGSSSGEVVDGGSSSSAGDSATATSPEGTSSGEGSSTGDVPMLACASGDGLAACYDFADVGSGMLLDRSGHGNDAAALGVGVTTGPFGEAASFDDDSQIAVPDSPSLDIAGPISVEVWILVDSLPRAGRMGVMDNEGEYSMTIQATDDYRCSLAQQELYVDAVVQGAWTHLACVYDGASLRLYVDGEERGMMGASGEGSIGNADPMSIGDTSPDFAEPLRGAIGGLRVWSRGLNPQEICEAAGPACSG